MTAWPYQKAGATLFKSENSPRTRRREAKRLKRTEETVAIEPTQKSIRLHGARSGAQSRSHIRSRKGPQRFRKIEDAVGELKASAHRMS